LAQAQDPTPQPTPRPTPTNDPSLFDNGDDDGQSRGTIQGVVYEDVNGDGKCVDTGTEGEGPAANVPVEFVSSDEETVITLTSGPDGRYALVAAGYSYWGVSARPGADWVVTSESPRYVPIYEDSLVATDVNFCVQAASAATVLLPASGGGGGAPLTTFLAVIGLALLLTGVFWQWRPRRPHV
jgi:hypothetical protein